MSAHLPENILNAMNPEDRKSTGQQTSAEAQEKCAHRSEMAEHKLLEQWLGYQGFLYIRARGDKKSTIRAGWPDFSIWNHVGKSALVEMKIPGGKLSEEQRRCLIVTQEHQIPVKVAYSAQEAIEWLREKLS